MRSVRGAGFIAIAAVVASVWAAIPSTAHAAYPNVYVAFPKWLGNCPDGNQVKAINGMVTGTSTPNSWGTDGWDFGDDIIYPRVYLKRANQVSVAVWCGGTSAKRPLFYKKTHEISATITPTRAGQTVWVGPLGVRYKK